MDRLPPPVAYCSATHLGMGPCVKRRGHEGSIHPDLHRDSQGRIWSTRYDEFPQEQLVSHTLTIRVLLPARVDKWIDGSHNSGTLRAVSPQLAVSGIANVLREAGIEGTVEYVESGPGVIREHL